jgi:hypothetical protein
MCNALKAFTSVQAEIAERNNIEERNAIHKTLTRKRKK